jgi:hypothetical protein
MRAKKSKQTAMYDDLKNETNEDTPVPTVEIAPTRFLGKFRVHVQSPGHSVWGRRPHELA